MRCDGMTAVDAARVVVLMGMRDDVWMARASTADGRVRRDVSMMIVEGLREGQMCERVWV